MVENRKNEGIESFLLIRVTRRRKKKEKKRF